MLATVLVAALLLVAPPGGAAGVVPAAAPLPDVVAGDLDPGGVRAYWTERRMRSAVPLDLDVVGDLIAPSPPARGRVSARAALTSPRSVGKLFFTTPQGPAVCSAAAVNTAQKNVIITAAHCAHTGPRNPCGLLRNCPSYFTKFLFVPRFANGSAPDGSWVGTRAVTHRQWVEGEDLDFDQALIEVAPRNGRNLVDVVGGNGLAWGFPARQTDVHVWGWPAEAPYDGQSVQRCVGSTASLDSSGDAFIPCPLNGGASGGPWFIGMVSPHVGFIWAVTSRRTVSGKQYLLAHPLDSSIKSLLYNARINARVSGTVAVPVQSNPSVLTSRTVRAVGTPSVAPLRFNVGRGQRAVLRARAAAGTTLVLDVRYSLRGRWSRLRSGRVGSTRTLDFTLRVGTAGDRWYRVRTATRRSSAARIRIHPCPLPYDRSPAVVDATACSGPAT
jgi:V8-like Glu-specific endopeptidase